MHTAWFEFFPDFGVETPSFPCRRQRDMEKQRDGGGENAAKDGGRAHEVALFLRQLGQIGRKLKVVKLSRRIKASGAN